MGGLLSVKKVGKQGVSPQKMEISQGEATASSGGNHPSNSETPSVTQAAAGEFQDEGSPELKRGNDAEHDGTNDIIGTSYILIIGDKGDEGDFEGIPDIGKGILLL